MFKFVFGAAVVLGLASAAHADSFRPGATPAGGRIGRVCNTDFLSRAEQKDCIERMQAAKNDAERKEIADVIKQNQKDRQKEVDRKNDNTTIGGPNGSSGIVAP